MNTTEEIRAILWICQDCQHVFQDGERMYNRHSGMRCAACDDTNQRRLTIGALQRIEPAINSALDAGFQGDDQTNALTPDEWNALRGITATARMILARLEGSK